MIETLAKQAAAPVAAPEDPVAMLGFARSAARDALVWSGREPSLACRREAARVLDLGFAQIVEDLDAILTGPSPSVGLEILRVSGALAVLLPEVMALHGFDESCRVHHKDLWAHTLEVVERATTDADLRWAALMHDVGKVPTRALDERGRVSFLRHERVGALLMRGAGARLAMAPARVERIAYIIEHHARVNAYRRDWSDRAVRRLARETGPHLRDLMSFSGADYTTRRRERASRIRGNLRDLARRLQELKASDAATAALPHRMGRALCEALDLAPGPAVGEHLEWLKRELSEGRVPAGASVETCVEAVRARIARGAGDPQNG
ncbi:MAG: HD domain-containing protein [Myxococcota bacterium]